MPHEFEGIEFDWVAHDTVGHLALFTTAGSGFVPPTVVGHADAHEAALEALLTTAPTTKARFAPTLGPDYTNTWHLVAERGWFAYDADGVSESYRLVAAPEDPVHVANTVPVVAELLGATPPLDVLFGQAQLAASALHEP